MTTASIIAFLAFLSAFNVPQATVTQVSDILYATQASTTQVIATTTLQATPMTDAVLSTSTPVQNSTTPQTFGAIIQAMPQDQSAINILRIDPPTEQYPQYAIVLQVLDSNGKPTLHAPVHAEWNGGSVDQDTNTQTTMHSADWRTTVVVPMPQGTEVTITSGQISKVITLP